MSAAYEAQLRRLLAIGTLVMNQNELPVTRQQWAEEAKEIVATLVAAHAAQARELAEARALLARAEPYVRDARPESCGACGTPLASCDSNCVEAVYVGQFLGEIGLALAKADAALAAAEAPDAR